jgi:hypothetical protein
MSSTLPAAPVQDRRPDAIAGGDHLDGISRETVQGQDRPPGELSICIACLRRAAWQANLLVEI